MKYRYALVVLYKEIGRAASLLFRPHRVKLNKICKKKYLSCVPGVDGKIHPSGFVQQGGDSASLVTAYATLRPRDGFSHPHQEHMKDTYNITRDTEFANVVQLKCLKSWKKRYYK